VAENAAQDLASLWSSNEQRFKQSRDLIAECGRWERQEMKPTLPMRLVEGRQTPQGFPVVLPHSTTMPQDVASFVARRQPSLKRVPLGEGSRAARAASDIETWLQEAFASKVQIDAEPLWDTLCAFATHDSEFAVLVQPAPSHYSGLLNLLEDDGRIMARWQRNADGLDADEYLTRNGNRAGYSVSKRKSREAQAAYARDFKARRWPFMVRVLSAPEYLPLGRDPLTGQLDTLLIRSVCTAAHLESEGFEWWAHDRVDPGPNYSTGNAQSYTLYELHSSNPWNIIYQIDGLDGERYQARKDGTPTQQGLDMAKLYGLNRLHAGQFFGWHRAHEKDPAKRGIPLLAPFMGILGGAQRQITGIVEHNYRTGFGPWGFKLSPEMLEVWTEMGQPEQVKLMDDAVLPLLGDPVSLVHQGVGSDAWRVFEFLMGMVNQFNEGEKVRSSPDASSIAQTTALASVDTVLSQISNGALQAYKFVAECLLEQCAALSGKDHFGGPIPVYCHVTPEGKEQRHVELGADDLMGDFTVEITQPTKRWSNLPLAQAGISWVERKLVSKREWREDFAGDEQPESTLDEIAAENYVDSDAGQQELQALVARIQGDREALRLRGLQNAGVLSLGGTPTAAIPPRPGGTGVGTDGVPTTNGLSQAQASVMGQTAAAVNPGGAATNVVTATGTGPEVSVP
jgi:hypothetical protein